MNKKNIITAQLLTYAGILPFLFLCLAIVTGRTEFDYCPAILGYSAIILSFLCGIHWAVFLFFSSQCKRNLLIYSNIGALLGWLSLLIGWHLLSLSILILSFLSVLALDVELRKLNLIPAWFFKLRLQATICVVFFLLTATVLTL